MSESAPLSASTQTFQPGGVPALFDRYQVLGVLGQGGMGTVYKGYHLSLKRFVAIKVLRIDRINNRDLVGRFLREMQAIGQMDHPNVVRATDGGEKNGLFYLVMEYLEGADLSHLVAKRGRLELADACELTRQAALGLDYIHHTLVHRDVKPSNLILTPAGLVKILDLGLARLHEADLADKERTPEGCTLGTFDYMAPEQAFGSGHVDARTDVYGLGCTLFKLLTGHAPFTGPAYDNVARKLYAHGHVPLTAIPEFASIAEGVRPVLLRMTAKDPGDRYASAGEVARDLAPFAADGRPLQVLGGTGDLADTLVQPLPVPLPEEISRLTGGRTETVPNAPPASAVQPSPPPRRRWRGPVAGLAVAACALVAAWFFGPALLAPVGDALRTKSTPAAKATDPAGTTAAPGPIALDDLEAARHHPLLEQTPVPVEWDGATNPAWQWEKGRRQLKVNGPQTLFFKVGTTTRTRFTFQVGIAQAPWTGNVGLFWGYQEDAEAQQAKQPGKKFASFQLVGVEHTTGDKGEDVYNVKRGDGHLSYDEVGELQVATHWRSTHKFQAPAPGENILVISVDQNRLSSARFGPEKLNDICSVAANEPFAKLPYKGTLGVFTLGHHATFGNLDFIAESNK